MNMDFVIEFIQALETRGCFLAKGERIVPDDTIRRVKIEGDKNGKRSLSYQLGVLDGRAIGWFRNFKEGVTHSFKSGSFTKMSDFEYRLYKEKIKKQREDQLKQRQVRWNKTAEYAEKLFADAPLAGPSNPYLELKKIEPYNVKQQGMALLVPIQDIFGKLWNIQRIFPSGSKVYLKEGRINGLFFQLGRDLPHDKIVICEGFATGCSIFEATGRSLPVYCALQATNLILVAQNIRNHYPNAKIVIAADNDRFTKNYKGDPWNPGLEYAKKAAQAVGGEVVFPSFPNAANENESRDTDFNDALKFYNKDYIRRFFI